MQKTLGLGAGLDISCVFPVKKKKNKNDQPAQSLSNNNNNKTNETHRFCSEVRLPREVGSVP